MTGDELIELIQKNGWEDTDLFMSINGKIGEVITAEAMFPKLSNTNDVLLTDGEEVVQNEEFWRTYYSTYMDIIPEEEADEEFHKGNPSFYILYCDGTDGMIQDMSEEEWERLKNSGVMFGYEKNVIVKAPDAEDKLVEGRTYRFADYDWVVAEIKDGYATLQSCGVTSGPWPGFKMPQFGNGNNYGKDVSGLDIHEYDGKMSALYRRIKDVEYMSAEYGKGLFLVSDVRAGQTLCGSVGTGYYWMALKRGAENHSSFSSAICRAWLGTVYGNGGAMYVTAMCFNPYGTGVQSFYYVIAPAFNIDLSKIKVDGNKITII